MEKVFIVVLHYRGRELTEKCLFSLQKIDRQKADINLVVVDNGSPEPLKRLKEKFPEVIFLKSKQNLGFSEGNNLGIRYSLRKGADYILLLNNDTTVERSLVSRLLEAAVKESQVGIVSPKIFFAPGFEYHRSRYKPGERGRVIWYAGGKIDWQNVFASHRGVDEVDTGQYEQQGPTDFASGCAMFVKKEVFDKVGFLDRRYFLYLEDLDFCLRAKVAGFKTIYSPAAKVWHYNAGSSQVGGSLHDYFFTRNRLLFGFKYAPLRAKVALLKEAGRLFFAGRPWQKRGVVDFFCRKLEKGSWIDQA